MDGISSLNFELQSSDLLVPIGGGAVHVLARLAIYHRLPTPGRLVAPSGYQVLTKLLQPRSSQNFPETKIQRTSFESLLQ